jgi:hypothetical protein
MMRIKLQEDILFRSKNDEEFCYFIQSATPSGRSTKLARFKPD